MADVIGHAAYGFDIEPTEDGDFKKRLSDSMNDDVLNPYLSGIIAYEETGQHLEISYLSSAQSFTTNMLYRKNFNWPLAGNYLMKAIDAINGLGFFDITGE